MTGRLYFSAVTVLMAATLPLLGNYPNGRAEGMELLQSGKNAEAAEFFVALAETVRRPVQKADALRHAALAAARNQQIEEALLLADQIPLEPESLLAKIQVFQEARQWNHVEETAALLDTNTWPDKLIYPALMARARANFTLGQTEAAESHARLALEHTVSPTQQGATWHLIAQNAQRGGADSTKALDAYAEVIRLRAGGGSLQRALLERARLLSALGRHDEALADLAELEQNNNNDPHWISAALIGHGEVHRDMGNKERAREHFQQAAQVPDAPDALVEEANKRLAELDS
jgi:tetratricopeptide (TPR) repeat protein